MLISGNPSEALATALQIENENNALIGSFDSKPLPSKKKPSLMSAFDFEEEQPLDIEPLEEKSKIDTSIDFTEEEIESMLDQEMKKVQENPAMTLEENKSAFDLFADEDPNQYAQDMDINPQQYQTDEGMDWFPNPKGE